MKTIANSAKAYVLAAFAVLMASLNTSAQDCASVVDKMCTSFNSLSVRVSQLNAIQDLDALSIDDAVSESGLEDISDDCAGYVLTEDDKTRLNAAFDKFIDAMAERTVQLCGGSISRAQVARELDPTRNAWKKGLSKAKTLGDFVYELEDI